MRAKQDFGRAQSTGRQYDYLCTDEHGGGIKLLAACARNLVMHQPTVAFALDMADRYLREDFGAVIPGIGQVVHDEGILRAEVASGTAVTTQGTSLLVYACVIYAIFKMTLMGGL